MADNIDVTPGTGKTVATDDVSSVQHQLVKLEYGTDGNATMVSTSNPLPVVQTGTPALPTGASTAANQTTLIGHVDGIEGYVDGIEGLLTTIDADTSALAGAVSSSKVQVDVISLPSLASGTNNIGDVDVLTLPALPSGTNTIGAVNVKPATSGGWLVSRDIDLDEASAANVKASAGQVGGWYLFNQAASTRFVKIYNKATGPTVGTDTPKLTIPIPAGGGAVAEFVNGIEFDTGIGWAATTGVADSDTGAPSANDVIGNLLYK